MSELRAKSSYEECGLLNPFGLPSRLINGGNLNSHTTEWLECAHGRARRFPAAVSPISRGGKPSRSGFPSFFAFMTKEPIGHRRSGHVRLSRWRCRSLPSQAGGEVCVPAGPLQRSCTGVGARKMRAAAVSPGPCRSHRRPDLGSKRARGK